MSDYVVKVELLRKGITLKIIRKQNIIEKVLESVYGGMKMDIEKGVDKELLSKFEFYNYGHALEILNDAFPEQALYLPFPVTVTDAFPTFLLFL